MATIKVKAKALRPGAVLPRYAHPTDACFDLVAASISSDPYGNVVYGTGLAFEIPEGWYMQIQPRSSNTKKSLAMLNSPGVIDSGYRGEVTVKFRRIGEGGEYAIGERVAQGVLLPCPRVEFEQAESLSQTERGAGGYGSTGK